MDRGGEKGQTVGGVDDEDDVDMGRKEGTTVATSTLKNLITKGLAFPLSESCSGALGPGRPCIKETRVHYLWPEGAAFCAGAARLSPVLSKNDSGRDCEVGDVEVCCGDGSGYRPGERGSLSTTTEVRSAMDYAMRRTGRGPGKERIARRSRRARIWIPELAILGDSARSREAVDEEGSLEVSRTGRFAAGRGGIEVWRAFGRSGQGVVVVKSPVTNPTDPRTGWNWERAVCVESSATICWLGVLLSSGRRPPRVEIWRICLIR